MRYPLATRNTRRILCVFPAYAPSFGTFSHAYHLFGRVRAFMPPQGLLLIAAYMPEPWPVRFIDENIAPASAEDLAWADAVFVSGMHIQAPQIHDIARRAKAAGQGGRARRPVGLRRAGNVSELDYIHVGEIGDGTDKLIARLDADCTPPAAQIRFETAERLPLPDFPVPAYNLIRLDSLSARLAAIFLGLSVSLRILRHPGALRPPAAAENPGATVRRTRCHAGARQPSDLHLFRRRQFHR